VKKSEITAFKEHPMRSRVPAGITMVEVLVVIAIVCVMAALVFPAVHRVRQSARRTQCANNLRQIGIALLHHCTMKNGRFPQSSHGTSNLEKTWIYTLKPYLDNVDGVRFCPEDPRIKERRENDGTSYILNEYICVKGTNEALFLHDLKSPRHSILVFTISDRKGTSSTEDHTHSRNWFKKPLDKAWTRILADIQPDRFDGFGDHPDPKKHATGFANYLYGDGHVQLIPGETVYEWTVANKDFSLPSRAPGYSP
jgi:prepilin-type processing-associated H-X9-DG protein/prepilin-type N-terminal cleavage/methylation domain-containing protein